MQHHSPGALARFIRHFITTDHWVGTVARKHGLFWSPNAFNGKALPHPLFNQHELPAGFWPGAAAPGDLLDTLFVDIDIDNQKAAFERVFPLYPTAIVLTGDRRLGEGGRGVHAFWRLSTPIDAITWTKAQLTLVGHFASDPCTLSPWQPMRVGGFGAPGRVQTLVSFNPASVSLDRVFMETKLGSREAGLARLRDRKVISSGNVDDLAHDVIALLMGQPQRRSVYDAAPTTSMIGPPRVAVPLAPPAFPTSVFPLQAMPMPTLTPSTGEVPMPRGEPLQAEKDVDAEAQDRIDRACGWTLPDHYTR